MGHDAPLTASGRARLQKAAEYESWGYETYYEALHGELGATSLAKSHVYTFPCVHKNRRHAEPGYKDTYVLKICPRCLHDEPLGHSGHHNCFLDNEVGIWNEAVRRGDELLFCPIVAANRDQGWMLMEHCDHAGILSGPDSQFDRSEMSDRMGEMKPRLRDRGWGPTSTEDMDVEVMAFENRLVVIDYEELYHEDWLFDPLCWRWSKSLRRDTSYTAATDLAIDEHKRAISHHAHPKISPYRRRLVEDMHYSTTMSL